MNNGHSPGWSSHALVFSILPLLLICWAELEIGLAWGITVVGLLDTVATLYFLRRSRRQILRLGVFGPTRARWWIEVAAVCWTLCMSCAIFSVSQANGAIALPLFQAAWVDLAFQASGWFFWASLVLTIVGFVVGLARRKRIQGRALNLVSAAFWMVVCIHVIMWSLPDNPILSDVIAPVCAIVAIAALLAAGAIAFWHRAEDRRKTTP
ncbi:MAG: hypothetical protein CMJ64_27100 [Planctomycetaceae bacterium]|nr:hypothetical protein [Planctomycetaceae bacterium]